MGCTGSKPPTASLLPEEKQTITRYVEYNFEKAINFRAALVPVYDGERAKKSSASDGELVTATLNNNDPLANYHAIPTSARTSGKTVREMHGEMFSDVNKQSMDALHVRVADRMDAKKHNEKVRKQSAAEAISSSVKSAIVEHAKAFIIGGGEDRAAPSIPSDRNPRTGAGSSGAPKSPTQQRGNEDDEPLYPIPEGNWVRSDNPDFYWSEDDHLFYYPAAGHFFDPDSQQWFVPNEERWVTEAEHDEVLKVMQEQGLY